MHMPETAAVSRAAHYWEASPDDVKMVHLSYRVLHLQDLRIFLVDVDCKAYTVIFGSISAVAGLDTAYGGPIPRATNAITSPNMREGSQVTHKIPTIFTRRHWLVRSSASSLVLGPLGKGFHYFFCRDSAIVSLFGIIQEVERQAPLRRS